MEKNGRNYQLEKNGFIMVEGGANISSDTVLEKMPSRKKRLRTKGVNGDYRGKSEKPLLIIENQAFKTSLVADFFRQNYLKFQRLGEFFERTIVEDELKSYRDALLEKSFCFLFDHERFPLRIECVEYHRQYGMPSSYDEDLVVATASFAVFDSFSYRVAVELKQYDEDIAIYNARYREGYHHLAVGELSEFKERFFNVKFELKKYL